MSEIDLNLLRVFDTLIELRSVTRAADRLGLTQSAVSHALARLRLAMDDRLFVRNRNGLEPTGRALEIAPGVREGLSRLRDAMTPSSFDPARIAREFVVAAGTYFCALLVPALTEAARRVAPGVSFRIVPSGEDLVVALDQGLVELALGAFARVPGRLAAEQLYEEELVWIAAAANPLCRAPVTAAMLAAQPQVAISTGRLSEGRAEIIAQGGLERQIIARAGGALMPPAGESVSTVYDAQTAIAVAARTDAVALVPRRSTREDVARGTIAILRGLEMPARIQLSMLWHRKQQEDTGLAWLRAMVREAALDLG